MRPTRILAAVLSVGLLSVLGGPIASAAPVDPIVRNKSLIQQVTAANGSKVVTANLVDDRSIQLQVYSAAMQRNIMVNVQRPADASRPRPTLYLLNGAGGGEDSATWKKQTDALAFLSTKNVNVVQPVGGKWSYYTDWRAPDPVLGINKWRTFFTEELPPVINGALGTNKLNAIAGLSTSGTSVLQLPIAKPGLYKSVAAYSGCAQISDPVGHTFVDLAVETWGGGNTDNMYGPWGDPMWVQNDPYVNAAKLRGLNLFVSTGTGVPGMYDGLNGPHTLPGSGGQANQLIVGGTIEAGVDWCTHNLAARLAELKIPATFDFQPTGTHSWGYWEAALKASWPVLAKGMGLPA